MRWVSYSGTVVSCGLYGMVWGTRGGCGPGQARQVGAGAGQAQSRAGALRGPALARGVTSTRWATVGTG